MPLALPSPDIATLPVGDSTTKAASTSFVSAAVAALLATLQNRFDIGSYKKAINAYQPGGVDAMYAYSCTSMGAPATIAFFAGSDVAGGDFETLVLKPWLMGATNPTSGPAGLGQSASQAAATIATLQANLAIIQAAVGSASTTAATFAKVANTGAYADLIGAPTGSGLTASALAALAKTLPVTDPGSPGAPWLDGGVLVFSQ